MPKLSQILAQQQVAPGQTMAEAAPAGLIAPGNIDLTKRPIVNNADGSYSTVRSISVDQDGRSYLIPTVIGDRVVSNDEAIKHFQQTGENLGQFKTWQDADAYAKSLHNEQAAAYDQRAAAQPAKLKLSDLQPQAEPVQVLPDTNVVAPERLPGVLGTINDFGNDLGDSFAHHLGNIPVGLAQLFAHAGKDSPLALGAEIGDRIMGQPGASAQAGKALVDNLDNKIAAREKTYQADVPTNAASVTGATLGEVLPWLFGLGEARAAGVIPTATSTLGKVGLLAAEGGTMGALQPVTTGADQPELARLVEGDAAHPSYDSQKALQIGSGAAAGPLLAGIGKLLGGAKAGVQDVLTRIRDPQTVADKYIAELFNANPQVLAKLQAAQPLVPGEVPSAAQVIATPEAVKAERLLRNNPNAGPAFEGVDNANNQARQAVIDKLAGTPADLKAAIDTRRTNAAPFIESALTPSTPAVRWGVAKNAIENLVAKPGRMPAEDFDALKAAKGIVDKVRSGALQEDDAVEELAHLAYSVSTKKAQDAFGAAFAGIDRNMVDPSGVLQTIATLRNGPLGVNEKVASGLDFLASRIEGGRNVRGKIGTDVLDALRQEASRLLGNAKVPGSAVGSKTGVALGPAKNQIVEAIERVAPGYRDYVAGYRRDSLPINTMESVGKLADPGAANSLNAAGDPRVAISRLQQVLRGDDKAKFPMSKAARAELEKVRASLLRRSISDNKIAASGPGTAADLQNAGTRLGSAIFGDPLAGKPGNATRALSTAIGSLLGTTIGGPFGGAAGAGMGALVPEAVGKVNARIATKIGETAADSKATAAAIQRVFAKATPRQQGLLMQLLLGSPAGAPAAVQPTLGQAARQAGVSALQQKVATP